MRALLFLVGKNLKNIIKSAFKRPLTLIGYIIALLFIIFVIVAAFAMPSGLVRMSSPKLFRGIMMLVFSFLYYTSLKIGIEKGSSYFRMADVNMAFTSPLHPNQVLLYGFIKQLGGTLLLLVLAMCQIPNLKNNFAFEPHGVPMLLLAVVVYTLAYPLISMVIYSWTSVKKERKKLMKRILDAAALTVVLIFILDLSRTRNFTESLGNVFDNPIVHYFPVIGWTGSIASSAVSAFDASFYVGSAGMLVLIIGLSLLLYRMKLDYYEDVLEATEFAEQVIKAKREGKNVALYLKTRKNVRSGLSGQGAKALFAKNILEIRKTSIVFFFDRMSVTVILSSVIFRLIMPSEIGSFSLLIILAFSVYMMLLIQLQGRWAAEVEKHFIFLIPASSYEKLFYATLSDHVKNLSDGIVLFTLSGILFNADIPSILASILSYVAFGAVFVYSDVLARRLFGRAHSKNLILFVKILFSFALIIPGVIAAVIAASITGIELMAIGAVGAWAFVLAITLFIFSGGIFNNLEAVS
ncbi:MAG TPA: putative ABC exporter domain-containing protein [Thermoclostridium sp.]|nr:ABC transporter permease [Clostridiaceae bacterium]HOQ75606.1 putative ABC exporter domain-containing protein [Thermoclostridium sp.]HPU44929.1 putative ABC exporter domain-containing protein [Thermoclostridium sp.]